MQLFGCIWDGLGDIAFEISLVGRLATQLSAQGFLPEKHYLLCYFRLSHIGKAINRPEFTALPGIEPARWNVCILSLGDQIRASMGYRPFDSFTEKPSADSATTNIGMHSDIPKDCHVPTPFQHAETGGVEGHGRARKITGLSLDHKECPLVKAELGRPTLGATSLQRVIVLDIRFGELDRPQPDPARASFYQVKLQDGANFESDWDRSILP